MPPPAMAPRTYRRMMTRCRTQLSCRRASANARRRVNAEIRWPSADYGRGAAQAGPAALRLVAGI